MPALPPSLLRSPELYVFKMAQTEKWGDVPDSISPPRANCPDSAHLRAPSWFKENQRNLHRADFARDNAPCASG